MRFSILAAVAALGLASSVCAQTSTTVSALPNNTAPTAADNTYIEHGSGTAGAGCPGTPTSTPACNAYKMSLGSVHNYLVTAPVNLAPNSQWEIASAWGYGTQEGSSGHGTVAAITASSNTTGTVGRTTFSVATTGELSVGDLVQVAAGSGVDTCLVTSPMRIVSMVSNTSLTVRVPFGCAPTLTHIESLIPTVVGNVVTETTGAGPDGWNKTISMPMWRNEPRGDYTSNMPTDVPAYASLGMTKDISGAEQFYINIPPTQLAQYQGKTLVFGIEGYQRIRGGSGTWTIFENDNVNGTRTLCSNAPTTGTFNWQECAYTIPANATYLYIGVQLQGAVSDTYYFANPVLTVGNYIGGPQFYQKPRNEILIPSVHISPYGWINAAAVFPASPPSWCSSFVTCFEHDLYAETGGSVAQTVVKAHGQLEGINCGTVALSTGNTRTMSYYDRGTAPEKSGSFLSQYVACAKSYSYMDLPLNQYAVDPTNQGTGIYASGIASDTWSNVSEELDWFILN